MWEQEDQLGDCVGPGPLRSQTEIRCVRDVLRGTPMRGNGGSGRIGAESLQTEMKFQPRWWIERGQKGSMEE